MTMVVIDATEQVMGRLASVVAKRLLGGEEIVVVNAEKALVTGDRLRVFDEYLAKRQIGSTASRMRGKGPYYPRRPDRIVRRAIRGMLPYQRPRGRTALKRLRVYVGVPEGLGPVETVPEASQVRTARVVRLGEVSERLGAKL